MLLHRASRSPALLGLLLSGVAVAAGTPAGASEKAVRPPRAVTGGALHVSNSTAEILGTVNPRGTETTYYFQYGTTTAYGAQSPTATANGTQGTGVNAALAGLQPGTTYHYRLVAESPSAGSAEGQDRTFVTKQVPLRFVLPRIRRVELYGSPMSLEGTLTGTGAANHPVVLQGTPFPYIEGFGDVGQAASTSAAGGFSLPVPSLAENTELRVRTLDAVPAYSQTVTVQVAVRVTLHARALGRGLVRLEGTVRPAEVGAPVVFQLVRHERAPVKVYAAVVKSASASMSRFRAVVRLRRAGAYRASVEVSNGRQVSGESPTISVHPVGAPSRATARNRGRTLPA